jgi:fucose 4-O-acetylase-like acetyltransferase
VSQKIKEIEMLKGISIIGVVLMHMEFRSRFSEQAIALLDHLQILFGWCVLAFFFCSGLLLKTEEMQLKNLKSYIFKRAHRLLIPCIVFSIFYKTGHGLDMWMCIQKLTLRSGIQQS